MLETPKIDVHGMNSQDAVNLIKYNLKAFYQRGFPELFIIHGHGQGILKQKIRELLMHTSIVKSIRRGKPQEGGDGVTVAIFK